VKAIVVFSLMPVYTSGTRPTTSPDPIVTGRAAVAEYDLRMLIALWPIVFMIVGALVYALSSNGKAAELGRLAYFAGLMWLVYSLMGHALHVG
jgi:hypothetical protein